MSFAPYTNDRRTADQGKVLGVFREDDFGHTFEYAERFGFPEDFHPEMPHVIFVGDDTRLADVRKTVLTLVKGDGQIEKWLIKSHREYK
jgi:hypothetical protein